MAKDLSTIECREMVDEILIYINCHLDYLTTGYRQLIISMVNASLNESMQEFFEQKLILEKKEILQFTGSCP